LLAWSIHVYVELGLMELLGREIAVLEFNEASGRIYDLI
jgi:hypothetical protein